jgi:hypothetical protein
MTSERPRVAVAVAAAVWRGRRVVVVRVVVAVVRVAVVMMAVVACARGHQRERGFRVTGAGGCCGRVLRVGGRDERKGRTERVPARTVATEEEEVRPSHRTSATSATSATAHRRRRCCWLVARCWWPVAGCCCCCCEQTRHHRGGSASALRGVADACAMTPPAMRRARRPSSPCGSGEGLGCCCCSLDAARQAWSKGFGRSPSRIASLHQRCSAVGHATEATSRVGAHQRGLAACATQHRRCCCEDGCAAQLSLRRPKRAGVCETGFGCWVWRVGFSVLARVCW